MMIKFIVASLLLCVALAVNVQYVDKAGTDTYIGQWEKSDIRPTDKQDIIVGFALKQNNLDKLNELFWSVSDPKSTLYGQYLKPEELATLIGTDEEVISNITEWLSGFNTEVKVSASRDYLWATFHTVKSIESALGVSLSSYTYTSGSKRAIITRTEDVPVAPAHIAANLDFISGLFHFPRTETLIKKNTDGVFARLAEKKFGGPVDPVIPIAEATGVPDGLQITFLPICSAGNESELIVNPCGDYGNAITTFVVSTSQYSFEQNKVITQTQKLNASLANCTLVSSIFGSDVYCFLYVPNLSNDAYVNLAEFSYCFEDNSCTMGLNVSGDQYLKVVPSAYNSPIDVRAHYGVPTTLVGGNAKNGQAVAEFILQFFSQEDLSEFFSMFNLPSYKVQKIVGPNDQPFPGDEASLDIQYIMGIGQGVNTWFWSMAGSSWIAEWAQAVINTPNAPWVHSISYGEGESNVSPSYLIRSETELQKLATTGFSVLVSSGDYGSGTQCGDSLTPDWPTSSPHVTSVGATRITKGATPACQANPAGSGCTAVGEVSTSMTLGVFWTTGGGFSDLYPQPSYQATVVNKYLATANPLPSSDLFNETGRAYPDVSAVGHYLLIVDGGEVEAIDGTSASAPIFAGLISLLNEERLNAGKKTLGFLNPWLYSLNSSAFYDVTVGNTDYCDGLEITSCCANASFVATTGWDPTSGLGTPIFPVLLKAAAALP